MSRPLIVTVIIFTIMLNFSTGIINHLMGGVENPWVRGGLMDVNQSYSDSFTKNFNSTLSPSGDVADQSSLVDRVLDVLNWGFILKLRTFFSDYMYGFTNLFIKPLMGNMLLQNGDDTVLYNTIIFGLNFIMTIAYMLGLVWLLTGKKAWSG